MPRHLWAKVPRNVSIALTNACDLRCSYCYAPKSAAILDPTLIRRWLAELDQHGCIGVGFGGGEPTLSKDLSSLCRFVTTSTGMAATVTTHGHRFDDRLAEQLKGYVHFVRLSMDGVGPTYERLRGRSFASFLERASLIRAVSEFGINFVVNRETVADLNAAVALASELGASEFLLLPEQPTETTTGIDPHTSALMSDWVRDYSDPVRLSVSEAGATGLPTCRPLERECGLRAYAHIDANGMLKRSSFDSKGASIGRGGVLGALTALGKAEGADT